MIPPAQIELVNCETGAQEVGQVEILTREAAKNEIDLVWWRNLGSTLRHPDLEPDRHWEWRAIVSTLQNKPYFGATCVRSSDRRIQAAMVFRVDASSALMPGERALFVDRLATAPHNREGLVEFPEFRQGGAGLLFYAMAQSYSLGFQGRVNLFPIANHGFYQRFGFEQTATIQGDDRLYELSAEKAVLLLKQRGLIDG